MQLNRVEGSVSKKSEQIRKNCVLREKNKTFPGIGDINRLLGKKIIF